MDYSIGDGSFETAMKRLYTSTPNKPRHVEVGGE